MGKLKIIEKIMIISIIIVSILGITYKIFAKVDLGGITIQDDDINGGVKFGENHVDGVPIEETASFKDGYIKADGNSSSPSEDNIVDSGSTLVDDRVPNNYGDKGSYNWQSHGGVYKFEGDSLEYQGKFLGKENDLDKGYIWYEDLADNKDVLCTSSGLGITGKQNYVAEIKASGEGWGDENNYWEKEDVTGLFEQILSENSIEDPLKTYSLTDALEAIQEIQAANKELDLYTYLYRTPSKYTTITEKNCDPAEAIILSELKNCDIEGPKERTPIQLAWWKYENDANRGVANSTDKGDAYDSNDLLDEAKEFKRYIKGNLKDGASETANADDGFDIDWNPEFDDSSQNYTKTFDSETQQWTIGPFKINYIDEDPYSVITNMEIYAKYLENGETKSKTIDKTKYKIVNKNNEEIKANGSAKLKEDYPSSGEEFYIVLDYDENILEIEKIQVDFKYMNAGGTYRLYEGEYKEVAVKGHIYAKFTYAQFEAVEDFGDWINDMLDAGKAVTIASSIRDYNTVLQDDRYNVDPDSPGDLARYYNYVTQAKERIEKYLNSIVANSNPEFVWKAFAWDRYDLNSDGFSKLSANLYDIFSRSGTGYNISEINCSTITIKDILNKHDDGEYGAVQNNYFIAADHDFGDENVNPKTNFDDAVDEAEKQIEKYTKQIKNAIASNGDGYLDTVDTSKITEDDIKDIYDGEYINTPYSTGDGQSVVIWNIADIRNIYDQRQKWKEALKQLNTLNSKEKAKQNWKPQEESIPGAIEFDLFQDWEYTSLGSKKAQSQTVVINARRWWNYDTIYYEMTR